jgi:hypothetical protein
MRKATWLLGVAAALAPAAPAGAQEMKWSEGEALHTQGFNCTSIIFPPARLELQTFSYVSQQVPVDGLPHAGDVFYASVSFGSIGDICGGGGKRCPSSSRPRASRSSATATRTGPSPRVASRLAGTIRSCSATGCSAAWSRRCATRATAR